MAFKHRVRKLEEKIWGGPESPCEACGGKIVFCERLPEGSLVFPDGEPCPECWDKPGPPGGPIRVIELVRSPDEMKSVSEGAQSWP
jgi:hypothetical protein